MATLAELTVSAQAAANKAAADKSQDQLSHESIRLEEFAASGLDRADYVTWLGAFNAQLEMLLAYSKQDSPATAAAKKAGTPQS